MFKNIYDFLHDLEEYKIFASTYGKYGAQFSHVLSDEDTNVVIEHLTNRGYNTILVFEIEDSSFVTAY